MVLAHSEVNALVTKAARGAGLSWGMAEEAGWAAEWLARGGLPAAVWAAEWVAGAVEGGPAPVEVGVGISDAISGDDAAFPSLRLPDGLVAPGYLLPFLHLVSIRFGRMELATPSGLAARVDPDATVTFGPGWSNVTAGWSVRIAGGHDASCRPGVPASVVDCLRGLALRTTVPPSEASRRHAGSESDDND